jgi:hypothetical protein
MDLEPGRKWVHEYAETGKPRLAQKLQGTRWCIGACGLRSIRAVRLCKRPGWNGPAAICGLLPPQRQKSVQWDRGAVGHKISAIGLPHHPNRPVCLACPSRQPTQPAQCAAPRGRSQRVTRLTGDSMVIPLASPLPFRVRASFSGLAVIPAGKCRWTERYDGKRNLHLQHAA